VDDASTLVHLLARSAAARPDAEAQKAGAQPALPPAPAEKTAEPIRQK